MIDWDANKSIYLQIAEFICDKIVVEQFKEKERIPSIRKLSEKLKVNPNTVLHSFKFLQAKNMIANERGVGYFVSAGGKQQAIIFRKKEFLQKELPGFFATALLLDIHFEELKERYNEYKIHPVPEKE